MINDVLTRLSETGFYLSEIIPDGKIHRFDREGNKNAWYVAYQLHQTQSGEPYEIVIYGDWKTGERHEYRPEKVFSKTDKKVLTEKIAHAAKLADEERAQVQAEAADFSEKIFAEYTTKMRNAYMDKKLIDAHYGTRSGLSSEGRYLAVPCRDMAGKLWGIQRIFPDGKKLFTPGQKIKGTFHVIEGSEQIYLCEGYSTGVSIHQATGATVVCAFNAGNMLDVAATIEKKFIVAADNDQYGEVNIGVDKAQQVAEKFGMEIVIPQFKNTESKPTDFNDLYVLEGKDAAKSQLVKSQRPKHFVQALGHSETHYYYTSSDNRQVIAVASESHSKSAFMNLMPLEYWEQNYPGKMGACWDDAENDLKRRCRAVGQYNLSRVRGTGIYYDAGKVICNLGNSLFIDGHNQEYNNFGSQYTYKIGMNIEPPRLNNGEQFASTLIKISELLNWREPINSKLFLGWLVVAPVCGAIPWRPHIWLTGPSGSGKTWIMENIVFNALKDIAIYCASSTTEAGLRQSIGADARPVIFDEFETDNKKSSNRVQSILELARQASSEQNANVFKGTPGGRALSYTAQFCALVASIRINLINEADKNRFSILELDRNQGRDDDFKKLTKLLFDLPRDFSRQLMGFSVNKLPEILSTHEHMAKVVALKYNARFGQQYGMLLAGYCALAGLEIGDEHDAFDVINGVDLEEKNNDANSSDENECLGHLLDSIIRYDVAHGQQTKTIAALIQENTIYSNSALSMHGIRYDAPYLYIANSNTALKKIFNDTPWDGGWCNSLRRNPDADSNNGAPKYINGKNRRCTRIKITL